MLGDVAEPVDDIFDQTLPALSVKESAPPAEPATRRPDGYAERKARAVLYGAKWEPCTEGNRNSAAYRHACQIRELYDLSESDAMEVLADWNARNTPALEEAELHEAQKNASNYGKASPGSRINEPRSVQKRLQGVPVTTCHTDGASELESLIEAEIDGSYSNIPWGTFHQLTDLGQCLTPGTRTVFTGGTGGNKSLTINQGGSYWVDADIKVAILALERGRGFHLNRVLAQQSGVADVTKPAWVRAHPEKTRALFAEHRDHLARVGRILHIAPRQFTSAQGAEWVEERAAEGCRIIGIDPVTNFARSDTPWRDDEAFMSRAEKAVTKFGASLICVTHPSKGQSDYPHVDNIAGGAAWARFADAVIWLQSHEAKVAPVATWAGTDEVTYDRTMHLLKTRSGEGTNCRLAYRFRPDLGLILQEKGMIIRKGKK